MAATDDMFELGRTLKPHGLKGEVAIKLDVDVPKHYASLDMVWVERQGTLGSLQHQLHLHSSQNHRGAVRRA